MSDGLILFAALVVSTAGMAAFALRNEAHWRQLLGAKPQTAAARVLCEIVGVALLCLSLALCVMADPLSMALLVWPMQLGAAAAAMAAFLTVHARLSVGGKSGAR